MNPDASVKDRIRAEWKKIMDMKGKTRREYIWDYYKIPIIAFIIGSWMVGSIINDVFINPPPGSVLTIAWMAGWEPEERLDELRDVLYPLVVEDPNRETVNILTFFMGVDPQHDMAMHTRFAAMTAAAEIDIVIGNFMHHEEEELMGLGIAPAFSFLDLRTMFAEAGISPPDEFLFFDGEGVDDPPLAFGIPMDSADFFTNMGFSAEDRYLGVIMNTQRNEEVISAIRLLWDAS